MRDLFDLLGLPLNAAASEVRRVCARRVQPVHPDFRRPVNDDWSAPSGGADARPSHDDPPGDVAVDFMTMSSFVDRMESGFFHNAE